VARLQLGVAVGRAPAGAVDARPLRLPHDGVARLLLAACNENVSLPDRVWGYAFPGLPEEDLQISWCWSDDPMFQNTGFGQRGKREGNKTCYSWISAVTVWAHQELQARHGDEFIDRLLSAGPYAIKSSTG
jgi:hypothetical protein